MTRIALVLVAIWLAGAAQAADGVIFYNGKPVFPVTGTPAPTTVITVKIATKETKKPSQPDLQGAVDAIDAAATTFSYFRQSRRASEARADAERRIGQAMLEHPGKVVAVSVNADKPPQEISDGPYDPMAPFSAQIENYSTGKVKLYPSIEALSKEYFGPLQDEIGPNISPGEPHREYVRYVVISDGKGGDPRVLNSDDRGKYLKEEQDRLAAEAQAREAAARKEVERLRVLEAEARGSADAKQEADAKKNREEAEKAAADEKAGAESRLRAKAELADQQDKRDSACANGDSSDCVIENSKLMDIYDARDRYNKTALCMMDPEGGPPSHGPCAEGSPPCIYCSAGSLIDRQARNDAFIARQLYVRKGLSDIGQYTEQNASTFFKNLKDGRDPFAGLQKVTKPVKFTLDPIGP